MTTATHSEDALESAPVSPRPEPVAEASPPPHAPFLTASHAVLYAPDGARCDACDETLTDEDEELGGRGLYVWSRHGEVAYEEPPLCASCAAAITITALQRWDIEEEEG